jgi:large subunit ribosomal protein L10
MNRSEKDTTALALRDKLLRAQSLVLVDFRGMSVEADTKLRGVFRTGGCEYRVIKNTVLCRAVKGTPFEAMAEAAFLRGPTAIAYSFADPVAPARVAVRIAKGEEKFVIKGGCMEGRVLDHKGIAELSTLPGKDEVRARLLSTLNAPAQNFLRLTLAGPQNFLLLLQARERAQAEGQA